MTIGALANFTTVVLVAPVISAPIRGCRGGFARLLLLFILTPGFFQYHGNNILTRPTFAEGGFVRVGPHGADMNIRR